MIGRRTVFGALAGLAFLALLTGIAFRRQRSLEDGLPPRIECANRGEAMMAALHAATEHGGSILPVLGTGSMAPYIPRAAPGLDPRKTEVSYVLTRAGARWSDVSARNLCLYGVGNMLVLHQAEKRTKDGWIMTGLHNERSDVWMTPESFRGIVAMTFVWPQQEVPR